jgi:hypothetical protein
LPSPPPPPPAIRFVRAGAEAFLREPTKSVDEDDAGWWRTGYDQVLMKEVIHHVKADDRVAVLRGLRRGLAKGEGRGTAGDGRSPPPPPPPPPPYPSILIVTRPQIDIDYPLWEEARRVWADQQPSLDDVVRDLVAAGFCRVRAEMHAYPCAVPLRRWQDMVRRRFWSTFSHFTDDELDRAARQMDVSERHRIDGEGVLHFDDRLLFITAHSQCGEEKHDE